MATKSKLQTYEVSAVVVIWTSCEIEAESWEDAVTKSKELIVTDFVNIPGTHNDSKLTISGIHYNDALKQLD